LLTIELEKVHEKTVHDAELFQRQMKDAKERWAVQEKVRRDQWVIQNVNKYE